MAKENMLSKGRPVSLRTPPGRAVLSEGAGVTLIKINTATPVPD